MSDTFDRERAGLTSPPENCAAVTPGDPAFSQVARALSVAESGTVIVDMMGVGAGVTIYIAAGVQFSGRFVRVLAGGTATGVRRWW